MAMFRLSSPIEGVAAGPQARRQIPSLSTSIVLLRRNFSLNQPKVIIPLRLKRNLLLQAVSSRRKESHNWTDRRSVSQPNGVPDDGFLDLLPFLYYFVLYPPFAAQVVCSISNRLVAKPRVCNYSRWIAPFLSRSRKFRKNKGTHHCLVAVMLSTVRVLFRIVTPHHFCLKR